MFLQQEFRDLHIEVVILRQQDMNTGEIGCGQWNRSGGSGAIDAERQHDPKGGANTLLGIEGDGAVHGGYQLFNDGKTQTSALVLGAGVIGLLRERFKQMLLEFLTHADTVILAGEFDRYTAFAVGKDPAAQPDIAAAAAIFYGIAGQVAQDALQMIGAADETDI